MKLHHVQVACPPGGEDAARAFYADGLGLTEVEKPADLRARGGAWFRAYDADGAVTAEIHVGVEDPFAPARKAHPAFVLDTVAELEAVRPRGSPAPATRSTGASAPRSSATSGSTPSTPMTTGSRS